MAYQETTKTSYGKRLSNSLGGIVFGFVLIIAAIVLLWKNEHNYVNTNKMLIQASQDVVEMPNPAAIDPALEAKLVHATAVAMTADTLSDPDFPVKENAVRIQRDVEYYQWVEHSESTTKDKIGGGQETTTTYTYSKEWSSSPVNSAEFKDPAYQGVNSVITNIEEFDAIAQNVTFGAYKLTEGMARSFSCDLPVELPAELAKDSTIHVNHNVLYYGKNTDAPEVGDVRVTFTKSAASAEATIMAKVVGTSFEAYKFQINKSTSKSFGPIIRMGSHSAENIIEDQKSSNSTWTWIKRLIGILLMIAGFRNIFSILVTILKVLPPLASIADVGVGIVTGALGLSLSLIIILIAWISARPVLAIILLVVAVALVVFLMSKSKKKAQEAPQTVTEEPKPEA